MGRILIRRLRGDLVDHLDRWANFHGPKPIGWLDADWNEHVERRVLEATATRIAYRRLSDSEDEGAVHVVDALEPLLARGLVRRAGRFVVPPMVTGPDDWRDWAAWELLSGLYRELTGQSSSTMVVTDPFDGSQLHLGVCESCTVVFRPKRNARRCDACAHLKANLDPALGEPRTVAALKSGEPVRVRVPKLDGRIVTSWGTRTVFRCPMCGRSAIRKGGAGTCSSEACKSRAKRRRAAEEQYRR